MDVLGSIMKNPDMSRFALGGGTSLALRYGHRRSVDIDLFCHEEFDSAEVESSMRLDLGDVQTMNRTKGSVCLLVSGIKVDVLSHLYPVLDPVEMMGSLRLVSLRDLSAMKINAVTNRGSKKDFVDLLLLHEEGMTLLQSMDNFCAKYGDRGRFMAMRSLLWFNDTIDEPDPVFLNGWTWEAVEKSFSRIAMSLGDEEN